MRSKASGRDEENDRFDSPIITPTTKSNKRNDVDISKDEIISKGIITEKDCNIIEEYTKKLFKGYRDSKKSRLNTS